MHQLASNVAIYTTAPPTLASQRAKSGLPLPQHKLNHRLGDCFAVLNAIKIFNLVQKQTVDNPLMRAVHQRTIAGLKVRMGDALLGNF